MNTNNGEGNTEIPEVEDGMEEIDGESAEDKAERLDGLNKQLFTRLKKAEGYELKDGKWVKPTKVEKKEPKVEPASEGLSSLDVFTLINAKVSEQDIGEVVEYAKFKGISISEALTSNVVKTMLADKAESRRVADGTNTNGGKRGNAKVSDDALLANASKGILPESDEDIQRLTRLNLKRK